MANPTRRFTTTTTGGVNQPPVAVLATTKIDTLLGSVIQLDGRQSFDPERQPLTFLWAFNQVPIGSVAEGVGFKDIRPNSTAVSFIPDKTGLYVVQLIVNDGELDSPPVTVTVNIQLSRVPCGENIIPDANFLWDFISNFWSLVEDREKITTVWSAMMQLAGAELIKLWGNDYNKSLDTIQPTFQRRWQKIDMLTSLEAETDQRIIVGKDDSGIGGSSGNIGVTPGTGATTVFRVLKGKPGDGDRTDFTNLEGNYGAKGRVVRINGTTYTINRVGNETQLLVSGSDLVLTGGSNTISSAGSDFVAAAVQVGDILTVNSGVDAGTYKVKSVDSSTGLTLVFPNDPAAGPAPSFTATVGTLNFTVGREFTLIITEESSIPEGIQGVEWRVPHLLHVPGVDFEARGVSSGDIVVFQATRKDVGLSTEVFAQVTGANNDRLGFEFSTEPLQPNINRGDIATVVESGGVVTVTGLTGMRAGSVGGELELLNGDNPGRYLIVNFISSDAVVITNTLASGADSGNPAISWVERSVSGANLERSFFKNIVSDLRIVPAAAPDFDVSVAAETLISFMPTGINLNTRPFSKYGITFKALRVMHNTSVAVDDKFISAPTLQEAVADPPVVLRENLDYTIDSGRVVFVNSLFSLEEPAPQTFWAECAIFDNSDVIEANFGKLVELTQDDLVGSQTSSPYLSAVKGLIFAFVNGPTMANLRLGLQILLGLPFSEEQGIIIDVQDEFSFDVAGNPLGRMVVEDVDVNGKRLGFRRIYLYSAEVGLENNPSTRIPYLTGDRIARFAPISKGVDVVDYVKNPLWWLHTLQGLEILKYFVFKVTIDSRIFDSNDVNFAIDFVKGIKPTYTRVLTAALLELDDDIEVTDALSGSIRLKFYDNTWGEEATQRANDKNHQGVTLWNLGSKPFSTRSVRYLTDVVTTLISGEVRASSTIGFVQSNLRSRVTNPGTPNRPVIEGDLLVIHAGQPGAGVSTPGLYEIELIDENTLKLVSAASKPDPVTLVYVALDPTLFSYGAGLQCSIVRRLTNPVVRGTDLVTNASDTIVASAASGFLRDDVSIGHYLVIEEGSNKGEYVVDALPLGSGVTASIVEAAGVVTVTGLTGMTVSSVNGLLEVTNGDNPGTYRITTFLSVTSVEILNPAASGADSGNGSIVATEVPRAPYISETGFLVRNSDGTLPVLSSLTDQIFRVVRPSMIPGALTGAKSVYNGGSGLLEIEVLDPTSGDPFDAFTPGMIGLIVNVSGSDDPLNDGDFLITDYISSGRIVTDSSSTTSDTVAGATVRVGR